MQEKITHHEHEHHPKHPEHIKPSEKPSQTQEHQNNERGSLESIRNSIEKHAQDTETIKHKQSSEERLDQSTSPQTIKKVKQEAYKNTLKNTQKKLNPTSRAFSKVIHSQPIESTSVALEKTIARPHSILYGGFLALLGSVLLYVTAKRYGFSYNFLIYALLYIAFYVIGLLIEVIINQVRKLTNK